ncbi:MAG: indolepyruvate oxidoreductase subunit beta [Anaerovoracaceae bacterium]|jgi:indolepyruvate ferredoxin oxidoreductase beta subunit|nr:indolepyruvate oxidoreductase subunit beta [Bacillota bacterium]
MTKNILLAGVGGQGTILAGKLLTQGLLEAGYDVKMSEILGMSQRGGDVASQVRFGDKVDSPVIEKGGADIIVAFEKMEALRVLSFLKPGGRVVVNDYQMPSMPILMGDFDYPTEAIEEIRKHADTKVVPASEMAEKLGNGKVMNIVLLGTIIKSMGLENIDWDRIVKENVKPAFVEINMKALKSGMDAVG